MKKINRHNLPFLAMAILALLSGLLAGLSRAGWQLPVINVTFSLLHGPLMVGCFLGTLISLERAVALGKSWSYLAPFCTAFGAIALWINPLQFLAPWFILLGSIILVMIFINFMRLKAGFDLWMMTLAAITWMISNVLWISGWPVNALSIWWIVFLVLTIVAERLQLAGMFSRPDQNKAVFITALVLSLLSLFSFFYSLEWTALLLGSGLLLFALWLFANDIARKTIKQNGLTRFIAACLLGGYAWLLTGSILMMVFMNHGAGLYFDATLHAVFVGFVFSMIFAHAPIIFPAIIGSEITFSMRFYSHWILLHLSLLFRVLADVNGWLEGRQIGALLNVLAILLFLFNTVYSVMRGLKAKTKE